MGIAVHHPQSSLDLSKVYVPQVETIRALQD